MIVVAQLTYPTSPPIALGGTTDAALVTTSRGRISARVLAGSVVIQCLRWLPGIGAWERLEDAGQPVSITPNARTSDGVDARLFEAGQAYYAALITTAPPNGSLANLAGVDISAAGAVAPVVLPASSITYTPAVPADWDGVITDGQEAFDELADRVRTIETGGPSYRQRTAGGAYSKGKVAQLTGGQYVVAATAEQIDGVFGNTGIGGSTAQVYPSGSLLDVTGLGLPSGDLYLDVATGNLVPYASLTGGNQTRYMGFCDGGTLLSVIIDDSFPVPGP